MKRIWIWNHYATNMFYDKGGRHHWFAKQLIRKGYDVKLFCATTIHNSDFEVETDGKLFVEDASEGINYIFIKTPKYTGNGKARIKNMLAFYKGLLPASKEIAYKYGKPDVIFASSVHPLTLAAGIKIAKKFSVPCVCEVRDLWPESLIEIGMLKRSSLISKILYKGEKWLYKHADKLVFTMPGGIDYIYDRHLDKVLNVNDIYYINNGIDFDTFMEQQNQYHVDESDLDNDNCFKVIYTGSIRSINCVSDLIEAAEIIKRYGIKDIKFIIYGDGDQRIKLEQYVKDNSLDNVVFKGRVSKQFIPYILSKGDLNIVTGKKSNLGKYGISWNKLFEYMASGKPIVANYEIENYNFIKKYNFGIAERFTDNRCFADEIIKMKNLDYETRLLYCQNALRAANDFDYKNLTDILEKVLLEAVNEN